MSDDLVKRKNKVEVIFNILLWFKEQAFNDIKYLDVSVCTGYHRGWIE